MTMLAVFRSRSETLGFISHLRSGGVPASAMATPREAGVGCGLSARFDDCFLARVRAQLAAGRYSSYAGIMKKSGYGYYYL